MKPDRFLLILLVSSISVPLSMTFVSRAPGLFLAISVAWLVSPALFIESPGAFRLCLANSLLYVSIYLRSIIFSVSAGLDPSGLVSYHLQEAVAATAILYLASRLLGLDWVGLHRRRAVRPALIGLCLGLPFGFLDKLSGEASLALPTTWWSAFVWVLSLSAIVALLEEVTFRGLFYRSARESSGIWPACIYQAVLFASVHYPNPPTAIAAAFLFGVIMGLLVEKTGSLWGAVAAHWANNCVWMLLGW